MKLPKNILPKERREPVARVTEDNVRLALAQVYDPELGASLLDLNMVRAIEVRGTLVVVKLVLTAPGCPLAGFIQMQTREAVAAIPGVSTVEVEILDEPWEPGGSDSFDDWLQQAFGRRA